MVKFIKQEAEEKSANIIESAKQKILKDWNRLYNEKREQLINKYKKKEEHYMI